MVKEGVIDAKLGNITKTYDVATANWGSTWRTPSLEDFQEVLNNCNISLITKGTSTGFSITGPNGHSIFLPLTGQYLGSYLLDSEIGYYWSSTIHRPKELGPIDNCGYYLKIGNDEQNMSWLSLFAGLPIRAVSE